MNLRSKTKSEKESKRALDFSSDSSLSSVPSEFSSDSEDTIKREEVSPISFSKVIPTRGEIPLKQEEDTKRLKIVKSESPTTDLPLLLKEEENTLTDQSSLKYFPTNNPVKKITIKKETLIDKKPRKTSSKRGMKREIQEEPKNWKMVYEKIVEYRRTHSAAVDTMGCERLGDTTAEPKSFRFQTLLSLMLSSRTKDEVTADAIKKLNKLGKITAKSILEMNDELLAECIGKVGFHRSKKGFIKRTANICVEQYDGDIPDTVEDLVKLPGVGPKMAYLTMQCAWFKNTGIGVDIHVHRISNRLGWVKTTDPEETRLALEDWLPQDYWRGINPLLVGFGQIMCKGVKPNCSECPVSQWCPSAQIKKTK